MKKNNLEKMVARHEGFRSKTYRCTSGKLIIGYGFNLDAGMPEDEAAMLMRHRLNKLKEQISDRLPWTKKITAPRRAALANMAYQMGLAGLLGFKRALAAMEGGSWDEAATEMLNSKWARSDSPRRAVEISEIIRTGKWTPP
jgi:lysozyme